MRARVAPLALIASALLWAGCGDDGGPEPDTSPPQVVRTEPVDGATGVAAGARIRIWF
ncbi:MAG: Ig-like domain-containing protein, partial [Anaerolineae bacterium]